MEWHHGSVREGAAALAQVRYEKRNVDGSLETANLRERDAFNGDRKQVCAPSCTSP
jgi:hypothetical protein